MDILYVYFLLIICLRLNYIHVHYFYYYNYYNYYYYYSVQKATRDCESASTVLPLDTDNLNYKVVDCRREKVLLNELHYLSRKFESLFWVPVGWEVKKNFKPDWQLSAFLHFKKGKKKMFYYLYQLQTIFNDR
jgi:hypothetical protein